MSGEVVERLRPLPRLLSKVELAQPLPQLDADLVRWAAPAGWTVRSVEDFPTLARIAEIQPTPWCEHIAWDVRVGWDAREAIRLRPAGGFEPYVRAWYARLATQRALGAGDEGRLRALQQTLGGILIDGRMAPFVLVLPQPDGTWISMGFETVTWLDRSPIGADRHRARILQMHELSEADRRYVRTQ